MQRFISVGMAVLSLVIAASVYAGDIRKDLQGLQGTWLVVECVGDGKPVPEKQRIEMKILFKGNRLTWIGGDTIPKREYLFKLVTSKPPKAMDVTALDGPYRGKTVPAIYEWNRDDLKICLPLRDSKNRPTEFESPEGLHYGLFVLKRFKP